MLDISTENVILPNKPLNNFELEDVAKIFKDSFFKSFFFFFTRYITEKTE